ncbi:DUF2336 domain-containing protein [Pseudemcibacter aquimaris]|uniref:DUF2336 domain-containing protein n=1 Tax=Pseudemcibacter aquimaris TaxID=2857064 RepID=UPI0020125EEC|nr:DUF2336 domain-containing protein [Pseudemcibacter aquimaris]MCC3860789.1 DUF2336 domain-containing protein [Pseudemcibacter aquimaris]WDU59609.1 DUF2336 domain-containing protein [Pseudemcibacter aquimaris]
MAGNLDSSDVARLLSEPTAENRAVAATKVSEQFTAGNLSAEERKIAEEIFKIMVKDAEVRVREALSESLKSSDSIPHDVAVTLANDVKEVSMPMLEFSEVLTDEDLLEIIQSQDSDSQQAIANRANVSSDLADSLVENSADAEVVATLMKNEGADVQEDTLGKALDKYGEDERVNESMAQRAQLPLSVTERLVNLVSEQVRDHLVTHHEMSEDTLMDLFFNARERATANLIHDGTKAEMDFGNFVDQLYNNGRLTETLIFRALCAGDVIFFEAALAKLADIPIGNAYQLIHDRGDLGLKAIYEKCEFSPDLLPVIEVALEVAKEMSSTAAEDPKRYKSRMVERIITQCETSVDEETFEYFLTQIVGSDEI